MHRITDILALAFDLAERGTDGVLATVVHTEGSAYRRSGAMLMIGADGRTAGMISGGCLEPHLIKRAFWLTRAGAKVQVYQTGDESTLDEFESDEFDAEGGANDEADEFNFGIGCNGKVHVLFERLDRALTLLKKIASVRNFEQTDTPIIATLIRSPETHLAIGDRFSLSTETASPFPRLSLPQADKLKKLANQALMDTDAKLITLGENEWFIQRLCPPPRLLICGAGEDVPALVVHAKRQDWHVTVIDSRPHYAKPARFVEADKVQCVPLEDTQTLRALSKGAFVAVMSHSLSQDRARLATLLANPPRYIGQLGPKYRTERLIQEITANTADPSSLDAGLEVLHYPIGFKFGGDGAEALALGIMAQLMSVYYPALP